MAKIKTSTLMSFLVILIFYTYYNYTMLFLDVVDKEEAMKKVTKSMELAQTFTAPVETGTKTLTPKELEIERIKKKRKYCSFCYFSSNIKCEERIEFLQDRYGTEYLEGLQYVLDNGADCAKAK
mmetsp:Transcript_20641/g.26691  ORF Transcript_20641/g.26691 Transcript_20641/m.26691 type:complete len:124 (+) Transcript_20641:58-429(+)